MYILDSIRSASIKLISGQTSILVVYFLLVIVIRILLNPCHVCAYNDSECYFRIKDDFHHKGDVDFGVFFPIHAYYTGSNVLHSNLPYYFNDIYIQ